MSTMSAMLYDRLVTPSVTFCEWSLELLLMVRDRYGFSLSRSAMVLDFSVTVCDGCRVSLSRSVMSTGFLCHGLWWVLGFSVTVCDGYWVSLSRSVMDTGFLCHGVWGSGGGGVQISTPKHFNTPFKSCFTKANSAIVLILQTININNFKAQSTVLLCLCVPTSSCIKNFYCLFCRTHINSERQY